MQIDPWGSNQVMDYARLRDEFGIAPFGPEEHGIFDDPHPLLRRGIVFGHRDFERVADAVRDRDPWAVMTGLMPSGNMHLGHKMVVDQVVAHQREGADIHIAVADFEAVAARGFTLEKAREVALDQYVHNYLALGLLPEGAEVYFQTRRHRVRDLADRFATKVTLSQMNALYGFSGDTHIGHVMAPLVQAADILHVQREDLGGPRPVVVPVGVDQDPHIRLCRDIAHHWRLFNVQATEDGKLGIFVKGDEDVPALLELAASVLHDMGYGDVKRNDAYQAIYVDAGRRRDRRAIDLALAKVEQARGALGFVRPAATFHRFMTGLQGGKMSSSKPETSVFLTEEPEAARKKVMSGFTGGRDSAEEQRRLGGEADKCPVYELYLYHLAKDDDHLQTVYDECTGGERLCGGCKKEAAELLLGLLSEHQERRDEVAHQLDDIVAKE